MTIQEKIALVTGGSRGIGRATALALARAGAKVAVNYKTHVADAEAVCAEIRSQGGQALAVQADVSISAQVTEMIRQVEEQFRPVAVLVNNAGIAGQEKDSGCTSWRVTESPCSRGRSSQDP
jgi:3-oxoacyl-[acyl-carrier protein] reductase